MLGHFVQPGVILVGLLVGMFVGISGVGGGSLMTPLLILVLRVHPAIAIGTDLLYSVPTKLVGALTHAKAKTVDRPLVTALSIGGIPGAILGVLAVAQLRRVVPLDTFNALLRHAVGFALLLAALAVIVKILPIFNKGLGSLTLRLRPLDSVEWDGKRRIGIALLGAIVGFCVSVTSIGSGSVTLPALMAMLPALGLRRLIGSDVAFAALLLPVAALGALAVGNANIPLAINLVIGSVPGVILGSRLCTTLPERFLRPAVATVLVFAGTRLI
jgi:uncharacterized membrane protein YfcA